MLEELLLSIIDNQNKTNIDLLSALKPSIDKYQFNVFFINLINQNREDKRIFMEGNWLVSTYGRNEKHITFKIFNVLSDNSFDDFIDGMKNWDLYQEIPF
jgi:hypothetical protein